MKPATLLPLLSAVLVLLAAVAVLVLAPTLSFAGDVADRSTAYADGERIIEQSVALPVSRAAAWAALTTPEGLKRWAAPAAWVDLRVGGSLEFGTRPDARPGDPDNVRQRILALIPGRLLAYQLERVPPGAPFRHPEGLARIAQVIELAAEAPEATRWTQTVVGFRADDGMDDAYAMFHDGNPQYLAALRRALTPATPIAR